MTRNERAYREQIDGEVENFFGCGSIGGDTTSIGTGEGASLSKTLVSLVDGLDTMAPVEVGRFVGVGDGILYTVQNDPANTIGEHWKM